MIGILFAMEEEIRELSEHLTDRREETHTGFTFLLGKVEGQEVAAVMCGIGKVNAAFCTGVLLSCYPVKAVINTGIGGALDSRLKIGDIVVSERAFQYDMDAVGFGYAPGEVPRIGTVYFEADRRLLGLALGAVPEDTGCSVYPGLILTADRFVSDLKTKAHLRDDLHGMCCEMEGAAIAQVCWLAKVPFLIVRSISDGADNKALSDSETFDRIAARNSLLVARHVIRNF